ncbi:hypothetical protein QJQ45_018307, partial [Haematococcus lacustris]
CVGLTVPWRCAVCRMRSAKATAMVAPLLLMVALCLSGARHTDRRVPQLMLAMYTVRRCRSFATPRQVWLVSLRVRLCPCHQQGVAKASARADSNGGGSSKASASAQASSMSNGGRLLLGDPPGTATAVARVLPVGSYTASCDTCKLSAGGILRCDCLGATSRRTSLLDTSGSCPNVANCGGQLQCTRDCATVTPRPTVTPAGPYARTCQGCYWVSATKFYCTTCVDDEGEVWSAWLSGSLLFASASRDEYQGAGLTVPWRCAVCRMRSAKATAMVAPLLLLVALCLSGARCLPESGPLLHHDKSGSSASASASARAISKAEPYGFSQAVAKASARADSNGGGSSKASASAQASSMSNGGRLLLGDPPGTATAVARVLPVGSYTASCDTCKLSAGGILRCDCLGATSRRTSLLDTSGSCPNVANCGGQLQCTRDCATVTPRPTVTPAGPYARTCQGCYWVSATKFYCTTCVDDEGEGAGLTVPWRCAVCRMRSAKATAIVAPLLLLVALCLSGARCLPESGPLLHHDKSGSSASASASARAISKAEPYGFSQAVAKASARADSNGGGSSKASASAQASSMSNGGRLLLGDPPGTATAVARVLPVGSYTASCDTCKLSAGGILRCDCLGATSRRTSLLDTSGSCPNVANCGGQLQCTRDCATVTPRPTVTPAGPYARTCQGCYWVSATKFYCTTCVDDEGEGAGLTVPWRCAVCRMRSAKATAIVAPLLLLVALCLSGARCLPESGPLLHHDKSGSSASASASARAISKAEPDGFSQAVAKASARADSNGGGSSKASASAQASSMSNGGRLLLGDPPGTATAVARVLPVGSYTASCDTCKLSAGGILRCDCLGAISRRTSLLDTSGSCPNVANCGGQLQCTRDCATVTPRPTVTPAGPYARTCQGCYWVSATKFYCTTCVDDEGEGAGLTVPWRCAVCRMRSAKATAIVAPLLLLVALCLSGARCLPESGPLLHHDKSGSSASASASARAISKAEPDGFSQAVAKASARADSNGGGSSKASASAQASSMSNGGRLLLGDPPGTATAVARVLPVGSYTASCDTCKLSAGGILRCDCLGATSRRTSLLDTSGSCPNVANCGGQLQCTRDCATVTPRPTVTPAGPYARTCQGCYWVSATKFYCTTCVDDKGEVCYTASCDTCKLSAGGILRCDCLGAISRRTSLLDTSGSCPNVANCGGQLQCTRDCATVTPRPRSHLPGPTPGHCQGCYWVSATKFYCTTCVDDEGEVCYTASCDTCKLSAGGILRCDCLGAISRRTSLLDTSGSCPNVANCGGQLQCTRDCATVTPRPTVTPAGPYARTCQGCYWVSATKFYCTTCVDDEGEGAGLTVPWRCAVCRMRSAKATAIVAPLLLLVALCLSGARCLPESGPLLHHDKSGSSASASASARAISKAEPYGFSQAVAKASARADSNGGGSSKASASAQASSMSNGGRLLLGDPPGTATAVARVLPVGSYTASCDTCKLSAGGILRCDCLGATSRRTSLLDTSGSCPNVANCGGQLQCTRDCATVTPRPTVTPAGPYARTCQGCYWVSATKFYCTTCVDDKGEGAGLTVPWRCAVCRMRSAKATAIVAPLLLLVALCLSGARCLPESGPLLHHDKSGSSASASASARAISKAEPDGFSQAVAKASARADSNGGGSSKASASAQASSMSNGGRLLLGDPPGTATAVARVLPVGSYTASCDTCKLSAGGILRCDCLGATSRRTSLLDTSGSCPNVANCGGQLQCTRDCATVTPRPTVTPAGPYARTCQGCYWVSATKFYCTTCVDDKGEVWSAWLSGSLLFASASRDEYQGAGLTVPWRCAVCRMRSAKATAIVAPLLLLVALCLSGARCLPESGPLLHHDKSGSSASASASARAISKAEPDGFSQAVAKASARADSNGGGSSKASASAQASSMSNGGRLLLGDPPGTATAVARVLPVGSYTASCDTCKLSAGGILRCDCLGAISRRTSLLDTSGSCPNVANCGGQLQCTRDCATVTPRPTVTPAGPYARTCQGCYWVSATKFYCTTCVDDEGKVWAALLSGMMSEGGQGDVPISRDVVSGEELRRMRAELEAREREVEARERAAREARVASEARVANEARGAVAGPVSGSMGGSAGAGTSVQHAVAAANVHGAAFMGAGTEASARKGTPQCVVRTTMNLPEPWTLEDSARSREFEPYWLLVTGWCAATQQPLMVGLMNATSGDVKSALVQMVSSCKAQGKEITDAELEEWFRKATGVGTQNTEDEVMEKLVKGGYQQKGADTMAYCLSFSLLALRLPNLPQKLMCMYFLEGLTNAQLRRDCARTQQGQRWDSLDALLQFARGRDVALRAAKSLQPVAAPVAMPNDEHDMCDDMPSEPAVAVFAGRGRGGRGFGGRGRGRGRTFGPGRGAGPQGRMDAKLDVLLQKLDSLQSRSHGGGRRDGQLPSRRDYHEEEHPPKRQRDDRGFVPGPRLQLPFLFEGRLGNKPCRVMLDTGASCTIISKEWLERHEGNVNPAALQRKIMMEPLRVLTATNQPVVITERRCGLLEVQKSKTNCNAVVMPGMLNGVDLILGVDWMHEHDAVLKVKHGVCTLFEALGESGKPVNLFALQPKHLPGFAAVAAMKEQWESAAEIKLLSPGQAVRQLRKGCSSWLMLVKPGDAGDQEGWHQGSLAAVVAGCSEQNTKAEQDPELVPQAVLDGLLSEYADVFGDMPPGLPPNRPVGHTIRTPPGAEAPYKRMYKLSPREEAEVKKQVAELLAKGLIEPSSSPYGAPILFVQKKDGSLRMCIDYRALNKLTVRDRYPLPRIDDLFDKLAGKRVFSSLDLQSGYHQIRITEEDVPKTAFLTPMGQFQFKVLCFGLTNAPATFQRMMNNVFKPLINECVLVYIDDILVMSNTPEEHVQHLRQVLQLMRENKFYAKLAKCEFNKTQLAFLGHIVGSKGIAVDPAKVQVVKEWPTPRNLKDLQAFLGLANYFRRFISNFSSLAAPLTNLTSKQVAAAYDWEHFGGAELEAFNALKEALCSAPVLGLPDFSKPFVVCTDASLVGTGGVLMQDGRPIAYTSKKMSPTEARYATGEQELLGIIRAVREWRCYLDGAVDAREAAQRANQLVPPEDLAAAHTPGQARMTSAQQKKAQPGGGESLRQQQQTTESQNKSNKQGDDGQSTTESGPLTIMQAIKQAYTADTRFADEAFTSQLYQHEGLWLTEWGRVVVPDDAALRMSYVRSCHSCQVNKSSAKKPAGLLQPLPIPERPWDSVSMDLIVKLPASGPNKYDSILVFVDRLTKMVHLVKTWESMTATQYAKLFLEHVFRLHGMPRSVVSDRGPQFHNKFWAEVTKLLQVQVNLSSAYHPETGGQTERVNRVIEEMLRHFIRPDQRDWAEYLPLVEFAINNAWQESVRSTPFYLNYGYHPRLAELLDLPQKVPQAHDFVKGMKTAVEQARQCLARAQKRMKSYQDNKRREALYLPGDMVLLSTQNMRGKANQPGVRKLKPRYVGPFSVQYMVGKAAVKLWLPDEWSRLHNVFHVSLVKPYRTDASGAVPGLAGPPPVQWLDGEPQYTVEKVVGHRLEPSKGKRKGKCKKRRLEFLVKWQGHGDEHNTWELSTQLVGCQELLARYLTEHNLRAEAEEAADGEAEAKDDRAAWEWMPSSGRGTDCAVAVCGLQDEERQGDCDGGPTPAAGGLLPGRCQVPFNVRSVAATSPLHSARRITTQRLAASTSAWPHPVLHHDNTGSSTTASASARASSNAGPYGYSQADAKASARADSNGGGSSKASASAQASSKSNGGRLLLGDPPGTATARVLPVGSYTASCDGCELSAGGILRCYCLGATSHRTSLLDTSGSCPNVANCGGELQCTRDCATVTPRPTVTPAGPYARTCQGCYWVSATKFYCTTCVDDEGKVWAALLSGRGTDCAVAVCGLQDEERQGDCDGGPTPAAGSLLPGRCQVPFNVRSVAATSPLHSARRITTQRLAASTSAWPHPVLHHDNTGSSTTASASARASSNAGPYGYSQADAKASARADSNGGGSSKASASAQASSKSNGGRLLLGDPPGTATARVLPVGSYTASCDGCELSAGGILRCYCLGATSHRTSLLDTSGSCPNVANCGGELQCTRDCATVTPRPTVTPAGPYARTCQGCYWVSATKFYCTTCVDDEGKVWAALLSGRGTDCAVAVCGLQDEERQGDCDGGPTPAAGGLLPGRCQVPFNVRSCATSRQYWLINNCFRLCPCQQQCGECASLPHRSCRPWPALQQQPDPVSCTPTHTMPGMGVKWHAWPDSMPMSGLQGPYGYSQADAKASARADSNGGGSSKASASAQASSKSNGGRLLLGDPPGTATARVLPVGSYTASCDGCELSAGGILRCYCLGATSHRTSLLDTSGSCPNVANCGGELQCTRDCATVTPRPTVTPAGPYARTCQGCYWVSATKFYCTTCVDDEGKVWAALLSGARSCPSVLNCDGVLKCNSC